MTVWLLNSVRGPRSTNGHTVVGVEVYDLSGDFRGFIDTEDKNPADVIRKVDPWGPIHALGSFRVKAEDIRRYKLYPFPMRPGANPLRPGDTRITTSVISVRRLNLSAAGNPRFEVETYADGEFETYLSSSDTADSHGGFENGWRDRHTRRATLTLTAAGRIRHIDYHD